MWIYRGREFTEDQIGDAVGFVYLITNVETSRKYIGKKLFTKSGRKQTKGKIKKIRVKSGWQSYWSSSDTLKEEVKKLGEPLFSREILHLCKTRSECSYFESLEIFVRGALIKEDYYNDWCSVRIRKSHLKTLRSL